MDIVVTGYAGLGGSLAVYNNTECREKLLSRYPKSFFGVFENVSGSSECLRQNEHEAVTVSCQGAENDSGEDSTDVMAGISQKNSLTELDRLYLKAFDEGRAADGSAGGVLAALWRVLKASRSGGMYSQRSIPILQQTIELCEMFELNPYRLHAPECRIWVTDDTGAVMRAAAGAGVPFGVIGFTSKGAAIRRTDTETDSSLRRPEGDELDRLHI